MAKGGRIRDVAGRPRQWATNLRADRRWPTRRWCVWCLPDELIERRTTTPVVGPPVPCALAGLWFLVSTLLRIQATRRVPAA